MFNYFKFTIEIIRSKLKAYKKMLHVTLDVTLDKFLPFHFPMFLVWQNFIFYSFSISFIVCMKDLPELASLQGDTQHTFRAETSVKVKKIQVRENHFTHF